MPPSNHPLRDHLKSRNLTDISRIRVSDLGTICGTVSLAILTDTASYDDQVLREVSARLNECDERIELLEQAGTTERRSTAFAQEVARLHARLLEFVDVLDRARVSRGRR